jgi:hypothetical protein
MGMIVEVVLEKREEGTQLVDSDYIPVFRHIETNEQGKKIYRTIPVSYFEDEIPSTSFMSTTIYKSMLATVKTIRSHLKKFDSRERTLSLPQNMQN